MNINELMNIKDVRKSATIFPRPCKLTFDLLTLKVVSESCVTWVTCMPILVFLSLSVLELFPMYATDRQTDVRQKYRLMPPPRGRGHNNPVLKQTPLYSDIVFSVSFKIDFTITCNNVTRSNPKK